MPDHPYTPHPSSLSGAFRRPFPEQVAFFRQKMGNLVPTQRWDDLTGAAHDQAFMVAGAQKADLLADLAGSIDRAIAAGTGLETFRSEFAAAVDRHDWHGWTGEDTKGGRAWRARTIYRTNTRTAYAAGRFAQLKSENWKYWVYIHGNSKEPRPEHLHVFNGLVLPPDHPFWAKHYPPSDWGCSCYVLGCNTLAQARRLGGDPDRTLPDGWDKLDPKTGEPLGVGKGWGYAPGASVAAIVAAKVASWPDQVARDVVASIAALPATGAAPPSQLDGLSDEQLDSLREFTGESFAPINEALRDRDERLPGVDELEQLLDSAALPKPATLYRGLRFAAAEQVRTAGFAPGDLYFDKGFASTSRSQEVAESYRDDDPAGVLMTIRAPAGASALDIARVSAWPHEQEVLIQRGSPMRVLEWSADAAVLVVELLAP